MIDALLTNKNIVRVSVFLLVFIIMALWETKFPRKELTQIKWFRWLNNLTMVLINSLLLPILLPFLAITTAIIAQNKEIGLFNIINSPSIITIILTVILLDMIIYWQHRIFHKFPLLWRLHRVHHADQDIDVTTGTRFHLIEIWLSMLIKMASVLILGIPPVAVLLFEILLNSCAMFNHSNIRLSTKLDHHLKKLLVTPDMHRVHHSIYRNEADSNYGFCLSIWDRWFNSYIARPKDGHDRMKIGINLFRTKQEQGLMRMLTQPFRKY